MRLEIGNKVAVLDDVLKGIITKIDGKNVQIRTDDGMILSFLATELVKIEKDQYELSKFSDINHQLLKEKIASQPSKKSAFKKEKNEVIFEVDLHINQLVNSTRGMDNFDMLNLQLDTAKRKLEYAISKRIPKIVFIHGVGEGVLKSELIRLFQKYPVKFYDASYKKYGLGATEVVVFQNGNF
ncbi:DNA mismatch repair protein MutS [Polaribacter gangjinensis]|uniref:DNA mismatch repair protein MutS n=1 Tax=Polaribacter gangjinensis TaxID=574710 RepID=A0A2S7W9W1_9FLAO|nr:DNA mismatch repair protein MutS [Polaribacter gangjinensis]PQJ74061.1 DNA mismatch repair protein MutS [Polaribacter gangjinensis]